MNMPRYILVFTESPYEPITNIEYFETEEQMHDYVNTNIAGTKEIKIEVAGCLHHEYEYKPVNIVIKYQPERVMKNNLTE